VSRGPEEFDHLRADFAAARAEARTDGRHQILRARRELFAQSGHRGAGRPERCPLPTGVCRRHDAEASVCQQHGRAIGDTDADGDIGVIADDDVGFARMPRCAVAGAYDGNAHAVDLADQPES
jgi:hypothetical protein